MEKAILVELIRLNPEFIADRLIDDKTLETDLLAKQKADEIANLEATKQKIEDRLAILKP